VTGSKSVYDFANLVRIVPLLIHASNSIPPTGTERRPALDSSPSSVAGFSVTTCPHRVRAVADVSATPHASRAVDLLYRIKHTVRRSLVVVAIRERRFFIRRRSRCNRSYDGGDLIQHAMCRAHRLNEVRALKYPYDPG